jgi:N-acetyl-gamma-glutamyl-phosphate reductase
LVFESDFKFDVDVLFLCLGHGESGKFLKENIIPDNICIIDLSEDFRIESADKRKFIYGLPELNRKSIRRTKYIANPGCYATAIELALLPLADLKKLPQDIHISAITGSTGAGIIPTETTHYSWRTANISIYNPFKHRHLKEIHKTLHELQKDWQGSIHLIPFRGNFSRGIYAACYGKSDINLDEFRHVYEQFYSTHPFIIIAEKNPSLKQVVNTNKCILHIEKHEDTFLIISLIDNLIKGASGQAIQNMNLMFSMDEDLGLHLKPAAY